MRSALLLLATGLCLGLVGCAVEDMDRGGSSQALDPAGRWELGSSDSTCGDELKRMSLEVSPEGSVFMLYGGVPNGAGTVVCDARHCDLGFDVDLDLGGGMTRSVALAVTMDAQGSISGSGLAVTSNCTAQLAISGTVFAE